MFGDLKQLRKYDILATYPQSKVQVTYECKRDRLAKQTGNVAVEHKALLHSEAEFIVYMIDGDGSEHSPLYQIGRETLIRLLKQNWGGDRRWSVVQGGEYQDWMTLIPVTEFIGLCSVM